MISGDGEIFLEKRISVARVIQVGNRSGEIDIKDGMPCRLERYTND